MASEFKKQFGNSLPLSQGLFCQHKEIAFKDFAFFGNKSFFFHTGFEWV